MRITGGKYGGRKLAAPEDGKVRPTSDRARQALFNILAHHDFGLDFTLENIAVADLFAGTGALGIEALSRGARFCLFVEEDADARGLIRENVEALELTGIGKIWRRDARDLGPMTPGSGGPFQLVFLDPPYGKTLAAPALASLRTGGWLAPDALLVVETARDETLDAPGLALLDERVYGAARLNSSGPDGNADAVGGTVHFPRRQDKSNAYPESAMPSHAEIFDHYYRDNVWRDGSGGGSREERTREYRAYLQYFIGTNGIRSVVDLGCGDWQFSRHMNWSGVDYVGVDVSAVVLENTRKFTAPGVRFLKADAVTDELPAADLLIAKDVLQHWSNDDILAFLPQLRNYRMALITNGFDRSLQHLLNENLEAGDCRPVDLTRPPFGLKGGFIFGFYAGEPKHVFLWTRA